MELYWGDEVVCMEGKAGQYVRDMAESGIKYLGNDVARSALQLAYSDSLVMSY